MKTRLLSTVATSVVAASLVCNASFAAGYTNPNNLATATPIKHLVVIFNENRSFDHYFATYPKAANPAGEIPFVAQPHTPTLPTLPTGRQPRHRRSVDQHPQRDQCGQRHRRDKSVPS